MIMPKQPQAESQRLLDHHDTGGNYSLLHNLFPPSIVAEIIKTPIFLIPTTNYLTWEPERNEIYSVKNGYQQLKQKELNMETGEASCVNLDQKVWKKIWKLGIPHKIRVFSWLLGRESLPTKAKLQMRGIREEA